VKEKIKPYVVCHMLASLDGKIDGAYMSAPECMPALKAYASIREEYQCKAAMYGTVTMEGSYADGLAGHLHGDNVSFSREDFVAVASAKNYIVSVDPKGTLAFDSNYIQKKNRPEAHVIEVLTEAVSDAYLSYLQERNISYVFAGKERMDCGLVLEKLYRLFSIDRLMLAGGGIMNWSLMQENLIDEVSLIIAPVADGSAEAVSIFERAEFSPEKKTASFRLKEVEKLEGDALWLRYDVQK